MAASETILLQVDIQANTLRLNELQKQLLEAKAANTALNDSFKAGRITQDELATAQVRNKQETANIANEQRALTKANVAQGAVTKASTGSITQLRAQLALATTAYNALSEEERDNTAAGQKLQAETKAISDQLKNLEGAVGDTRRNVGNYKEAIGPLVQELVKLQEQEKKLATGSQELAENQRAQIGFQSAAQQSLAKSGKSYDEATKEITAYAAAIRPATANLVKLEAEQAKVIESSGETSEAARKIGFQVASASKKIEEAAPSTKKFSTELLSAAKNSGTLGGAVGQVEGITGRFTQAQGLAKLALGGTATATNVLKVALLALPIFAVIAVLGTLYSFLTRTQEGLDFVERKTKGVTVVLGVLTDKASAVGKALFEAFSNPKQALSDLVDFVGNNLLNRLKSFGVILDAIVNRDLGKLQDGFIQLGTGVTDAAAKTKAFTAELLAAAAAGEVIATENQRIRDTEREINVARAQGKKDIEALKLLAEDQTQSATVRATAAKKAFDLEQTTINAQLKLQRDRIKNIEKEQALTNNLTADNQNLADEKIRLAELEEGSLTRQTELQNKINEIRKSSAEKDKAARDKATKEAEEAQKRQFADYKAAAELRVLLATKGSEQEREAREEQIEQAARAELAQAGLTANQRKLIEAKALEDTAAVRREYEQARQDAIGKAAEQDIIEAGKRLKEEEQSYQYKLRDLNKYQDAQQTLLDRALADRLVSENEYERKSNAIEKSRLDAQAVLNERYAKDSADQIKRLVSIEIKEKNRARKQTETIEQAKKDIQDQTVAAGIAGTEALIKAFGEESEAGQAAMAIRKALSLVQIGINLQEQLSANAVAAAKISATAPPVSVPIGAAYLVASNALSIASAAASAAAILAFRQGGAIDGPGTGTSDSVEVSGPRPNTRYFLSQGEHVLTSEEVRNMGGHGAVERMRAAYRQPGGESVLAWLSGITVPQTRFATGGAVGGYVASAPVLDGGFAQRAASEGGQGINYDQLGQALAKYMPTEIGFKSWVKARDGYEAPRNRASIGRRKP